MHLVTNNGVLAVKIVISFYRNNFTSHRPTETVDIANLFRLIIVASVEECRSMACYTRLGEYSVNSVNN